jgi:hypothetical protein
MSEPVGNAARTPGQVPGNSHRDREAPKKDIVEDAPPAKKMVEGKVVTRKVPWYKRFAHSLIADDASSIGDYLVVDILVPAVRNLIADTIKGGTDRVIYGHSRGRARGSMIGERGSLRTRYDQISEGEPRRMLSREARATHNFNDIVLADREEAVEVVEALIDRVHRFKTAAVSDLYDFVGETGSYADRNWGWTDLRDADVRQVRGGWLLDLPKPEPLR